jgi:hypothetical protein
MAANVSAIFDHENPGARLQSATLCRGATPMCQKTAEPGA